MNAYEPVGYLASLLVLATFCMRDMVSLRVVAIASNIAANGKIIAGFGSTRTTASWSEVVTGDYSLGFGIHF